MSDEVKKYTSGLERAIETWAQKTQKDLDMHLGPIAKQLEDLGGKKNPSADDKKQSEALSREALARIERRMVLSMKTLNINFKKVDPPEDLDDKQSNILEGQLKELTDDSINLDLSESLKKALKLKDIDIYVNPDDKGFIMAKTWRFKR
jgi:hypothetical protein